MPESFLYFLWQYQYFSALGLSTTEGEPVQVLHPGFRNPNAGPDFLNARLIVGDVEWGGTVEAHTKTSDWLAHRHQHDPAYDNVILHLVWENDRPRPQQAIARTDGTPIPTLELKDRTAGDLLQRYLQLADSGESIPCAGQFQTVHPLRRTAMLDKALMQRLEQKAGLVYQIYEATGQDWEETTYRLLAINFGFRINADPMEQLSRAVPLKVIQKHRNTLIQVEAMLFGTAGMLRNLTERDEYTEALLREYRFLSAKYNLADKELPGYIWKWSRLRPANFPTLRLAQIVSLLTLHRSLFSVFMDTTEVADLLRALQIHPSDYWRTHYRFGKATEKAAPMLGSSSASTLLINTAVPLLAAYAHHRNQPHYIDRAVGLLEQLPAEKNNIITRWTELDLPITSAFDSQASLELYNEFCLPKKCLNCQIGLALVRPGGILVDK
ncbi:DUF2851 family protein [Nibrella saemangeumensis]|uniref:DUF2851 family protein n=1 Tax=Nibrella saemangeumensis TaxID=1084526 RepID=A0ABP8MXU3_9BACT